MPAFSRALTLGMLLLGALTLIAACGGGSGGNDGNEVRRSAFQVGGVREADGTVAYCGDYATPQWSPLGFVNNVWGKEGITDYEQCILARDGDMGVEHGWRWGWPTAS